MIETSETSTSEMTKNVGVLAEKNPVSVRAVPTGDGIPVELDRVAERRGELDLRQFHQMMRGRYRVATVLLVIGAIAGSVVGFKCGRKVYASQGMIEVKASLPTVLYPVDDKGTLPMFDSYIEAQAARLKSQDVINQAMLDDSWQKVHPGTNDDAIEEFSKELTVTHQGQVIFVQVVDPDPRTAQTAVDTLIKAYEELYRKQDENSDDARKTFLNDRVSTLTKDLNFKRERIRAMGGPYGSDDLHALQQFKQEHVNRIDSQIQDAQILLSQLSVKAGSSATQPAIRVPTVDELAATNAQLAQLLQQGRDYDLKIASYRAQRFGDEHPLMREAETLRELNQQETDKLVARLQKEFVPGSKAVAASGVTMDAGALQAQIAVLNSLRKTADDDRLSLYQNMVEIDRLRTEAADTERQLDEAQHRLDALNAEQTLNTRIAVLSHGDRPLSAYRNTQLPFSAAGGFGGGMLGFGCIALFALMDSRLRTPDHSGIARLNSPILGVLPTLPTDLLDPEHASIAAHCVHEIRTLLQIWSRQNIHRAFGITSPHSGAGKTSLTLALGASYAASNLRTLVIDCDFVAGGLTHRVDIAIPRSFGDILVRDGLIRPEQMADVVKVAGQESEAQAEMLVAWNVITAEQAEHALAAMVEEPVGIVDAMHGMPVSRCVAETGIENLFVMPVGSATARDVSLLSPETMQRLVDSVRARFDVVLIDTGPILGSLEASLVAGAVDGVVMTVAKGDKRTMVERAMTQLVTVGARVAGIVFNGATIDELASYSSGSSSRRSSSPQRATKPGATLVPDRFGPLTTAVASSAPTHRRNSVRESN